jgi:citrate lyase synthetase
MDMQTFSYPTMPSYTHDHAVYCRQMHDWHMKMVKHHEEIRVHHMERARQFQQPVSGTVVPLERPNDGAA